jgi:hypothetical protein
MATWFHVDRAVCGFCHHLNLDSNFVAGRTKELPGAGRRSHCSTNLKQIGLAVHGCHDTNNGVPPQATDVVGGTFSGNSGQARILPFIEQNNSHAFADFSLGYAAQPTSAKLPLLCALPDGGWPAAPFSIRQI